MNVSTIVRLCVCAAILTGCGATIPLPVELLSARQAYAHASLNPGAQLVPEHLKRARDALGRAEQSFREDPSSHITRDLADHATVEARIAELRASTASDSALAAGESFPAGVQKR